MSKLISRVRELVPLAVPVREADSERELLLFGPPGTGKTTAMLRLLRAHLEAGISPERLAVFTFTRSARAEIQDRLGDICDPREMPWLSTIHSACFRLLGLRREQTMQPEHYKAFGRPYGLTFTGGRRDPDDPYSGGGMQTFGDWCLAAEELRRARCLSHRQAVDQFWVPPVGEGWFLDVAEAFTERLRDYKQQTGMVEFSDMLERVLEEGLRPPCTHFFIDEAQDLSPLQWRVVDLWAERASRLMVFGDDDQAIYVFGGADPRLLHARRGHQLVLSQSFRLPVEVHAEALRLSSRIRVRVEKEFASTGKAGRVERAYAWHEALGDLDGETTFVAARNKWFLDGARGLLTDYAVPFIDRAGRGGMPRPESPQARALKTALTLNERGPVGRSALRTLRNQVREGLWPHEKIPSGNLHRLEDLVEYGATARLVELLALDPLLALNVDDYVRELVRRLGREVLEKKPLIELGTVHGFKGEEAARVIVCVNMTNATYLGYLREAEDEHRVVYVGATRAKRHLTWVTLPDSNERFYDL